jgi:hypothetical protein
MQLLAMEGKLCDLYVYFHRPQDIPLPLPPEFDGKNFSAMTFTQFYTVFTYGRTNGRTYSRKPQLENVKWFHIKLRDDSEIFITMRYKPKKSIVVMGMIPPSAGEAYYLRLLLMNVPTRSYRQLYRAHIQNEGEDPQAHTFQHACLLLGLLTDRTEALRAFDEAMI